MVRLHFRRLKNRDFGRLCWKLSTLLLILLLLYKPALAEKKILYVSPNGNDQWSGSYADTQKNDGPLATLDAARLKVRQLKAANPDVVFEVQIRNGVYKLRETVVFEPEDSGNKGAPVVYKAYPGEKPVFTGGVQIGKWSRCTKNPIGVSSEAKGKLWVAQVPKMKNTEWNIKSLYDGDSILKRSISGELFYVERDRENDYNLQGKKIYGVLDYEGEPVKPFDRDLYYKGNDMRDWENPQDIEVILRQRPWSFNLIPLEKIDAEKKIAWMAVDPTYQPKKQDKPFWIPDNPYWIENAIDYLDEPGEWVFNSVEGKIYIWPENDLKEMDVIAPYLQEFIRVEGEEDGRVIKYLHFEGLTFKHGLRDTWAEGDKGLQHDWEMYDKGNAVIRFRHAEDCLVNECKIIASSGTGIRLDLHCQRITLSSNLLEYLGGSGIVLSGYGPGTKDVNKNNVVTNNYIHHIGELYWHSSPLFITQSGHNKITHNTISDVPYNGIVLSGCRPHEFYLVNRIPFRRAWVSSIRVDECEPYTLKALNSKSKTSIKHFLPLLHARENVISMNEISRTLLKLGDGNAIYLSAMGENNILERNFMHHNYHVAGTIRLDDNPSYTIINENVIMESERGIGIKGACELNNNFVFTSMFMRGKVKPYGGDSSLVKQIQNEIQNERNIFVPPVKTKEKNGYYLSNKEKEVNNMPYHTLLPNIKNSIYFSTNEAKPFVPKADMGTDLVTGEKITPGKDAVKLLYADPMFEEEAMTQKIFRFKDGSPAIKLGIKPIDLSKVGSTLAE